MRLNWTALAAAALLAAASGDAIAQGFTPDKPVDIVVHAGPGGANDIFGRVLINLIDKEKLAPVRFVMQNKTGGGSTNAMNFMKERTGSDQTIGIYASNWTSDPLVQKQATNTLQDMTPIANLIVEPALVVVGADSPFKTLKDFIDAAKANPGKLKQSGGSPLGRDAMVRYLLMANTGAQWPYISFQSGGERIAAVLGGHADLYVLDATEAGDLVRSGKLRAIAQVAESRIPAYPDVPTIKEAGFDIAIPRQARGIVGPPGMPKEAAAYYEDLFARLVKTDGWKKYIADNNLEAVFMPAAEQGPFLAAYRDRMRDIIKGAGMEVVR